MEEKDLFELKKFGWLGTNIETIKEEYNKNPLFRQAVDCYNALIRELEAFK